MDASGFSLWSTLGDSPMPSSLAEMLDALTSPSDDTQSNPIVMDWLSDHMTTNWANQTIWTGDNLVIQCRGAPATGRGSLDSPWRTRLQHRATGTGPEPGPRIA